MKLLTRRPFSVHELTVKLLDQTSNPSLVSRTVRKLISQEYLDDRKYIEAYLHSRERKCEGFSRVAYELRARGVPGDLVQESLRELYPVEQEKSLLHRALLKKARTIPPPMDEKKTFRLYNHLLRKGFRDEDIRREIQSFMKDPGNGS